MAEHRNASALDTLGWTHLATRGARPDSLSYLLLAVTISHLSDVHLGGWRAAGLPTPVFSSLFISHLSLALYDDANYIVSIFTKVFARIHVQLIRSEGVIMASMVVYMNQRIIALALAGKVKLMSH
jgi:hypothetical protein